MCVCVCVCLCVCASVCVCVCICVHVCVSVHVCVHVCMVMWIFFAQLQDSLHVVKQEKLFEWVLKRNNLLLMNHSTGI